MKEAPERAAAVPDTGLTEKEVLDFQEAAAFLGVSTKTFSKVLRTENLPGRKVGREWKFAKAALLAWLGSGSTRDYKDEEDEAPAPPSRAAATPAPTSASHRPRGVSRDSFSVDED